MGHVPVDRDSLASLTPGGLHRSEELSELRRILLHRLRNALSSHARVDEAFLEDVVQESIVRILDRLQQFEGRSKFLTWATTIALRVALSELRRKEWKHASLDQVLEESPVTLSEMVDSRLTPDAQWEQTANVRMVNDLITNELTERQRTALLAELQGTPLDEIARQMNVSRNAIYKLTHDARKHLKKLIKKRGLSLDDLLSR